MDIGKLLDYFFHLDRYLNEWAAYLGPWTYVLLFAIVFCETGLVIMPFLPGDSLLFAVGALAASEPSPIDVFWVTALICVAAVGGDALNYSIGKFLGPKVFSRESSRLLNKEHLVRTQQFYEKHGGKTIILARFIPIVRTFAPFVAGIGRMRYRSFALFNVFGGIGWVVMFTYGGYLFGQAPVVKEHFHYVLIVIVLISVVPILIEWWRVQSKRRATASDQAS